MSPLDSESNPSAQSGPTGPAAATAPPTDATTAGMDASLASSEGSAAGRGVGGTQSLPDSALDFAAKMFNLARAGDPVLVEYLRAGLPCNLTNNRGDTLLMLAAYHGHASLVSSLLSLPTPSDPNQLNGRGQSPLAGAVFKGYDDVIYELVRGGADPLAGQPNAEDTAKMFGRWAPAEGQGGDRSEGAEGNGGNEGIQGNEGNEGNEGKEGNEGNEGKEGKEGQRKRQVKEGFKKLFEEAPGRGKGAREAPPAVPDREEVQRTM